MNGDGYWDLAVGADSFDLAFIYMGGPAGVSLVPATTLYGPDKGNFGSALSGADVDGDGIEDLAIGAHNAFDSAGLLGAVYWFRGSASGVGTTATKKLKAKSGFNFGSTVDMSTSGS